MKPKTVEARRIFWSLHLCVIVCLSVSGNITDQKNLENLSFCCSVWHINDPQTKLVLLRTIEFRED